MALDCVRGRDPRLTAGARFHCRGLSGSWEELVRCLYRRGPLGLALDGSILADLAAEPNGSFPFKGRYAAFSAALRPREPGSSRMLHSALQTANFRFAP